MTFADVLSISDFPIEDKDTQGILNTINMDSEELTNFIKDVKMFVGYVLHTKQLILVDANIPQTLLDSVLAVNGGFYIQTKSLMIIV